MKANNQNSRHGGIEMTMQHIGMTAQQREQFEESKKRNLELIRQREEEYYANGIIQLPLWREDQRGTPNGFLRSALFAAIQGKDRADLKKAQLFSQQGITITYK
jgi:hypothetical protein